MPGQGTSSEPPDDPIVMCHEVQNTTGCASLLSQGSPIANLSLWPYKLVSYRHAIEAQNLHLYQQQKHVFTSYHYHHLITTHGTLVLTIPVRTLGCRRDSRRQVPLPMGQGGTKYPGGNQPTSTSNELSAWKVTATRTYALMVHGQWVPGLSIRLNNDANANRPILSLTTPFRVLGN